MENQSPSLAELPKYQLLHKRGVLLSDEEIDLVVDHISRGMEDAYDYLGAGPEERTLRIISSDNLYGIGYAVEQGAINIPVTFLNNLQRAGRRLTELTVFRAPVLNSAISLPRYFRNAGREETVHHFQRIGHPKLHAQIFDLDAYMRASVLDRLLCDYEVEARRITDAIAIQHEEKPLWESYDAFLERNYKDRYNQPLRSGSYHPQSQQSED